MPIIVKNLNYVYNVGTPFYKQALSNISFKVEDGDFFGIIGHTGSGKSTLIQHFNALIAPSSGEIFVEGQLITDKKADLRLLRRQVGMVFQYPEYQLFAETVYEDVAFGIRNFHNDDIKKSRKDKSNKDKSPKSALTKEALDAMVIEALSLVGLDYDEVKDKSPFDLSGGQKRRVAIAGVIATKPKILVLDEPTAGLDPQGKKEIFELIHHLKKTCSPTIVMISHDMNEIARNCNRIAVLKKGELICIETPEKLFLTEGLISKLGMDLPESVKLMMLLKTKGINIAKPKFSASEMAEEIFNAIKGVQENA